MAGERATLFKMIGPWLDPTGFNDRARITALDGWCDRNGIARETPVPAAANDNAAQAVGYDREALKRELILDEGFRSRTYRCTAGKLSIGVGRNLDDVGIRPEETARLGITKAGVIANGITRDQAMELLDYDIGSAERDLDRHLPWWRKLDPVRQRVILNMSFNMGIGTLLDFKNTLRFMESGDFGRTADGMLASKWAGQVGERALRLAFMMRNGRVKA